MGCAHATVTAFLRVPGPADERQQVIQIFGTSATDLLTVRDWLGVYAVTDVAMKSTGGSWKPIYYALEDAFRKVLLMNAAHLAKVPGRETDVRYRLDRATAGVRAPAGELRAAAANAGNLGSHAVPEGPHPGPDPAGEPPP
jgi:hypothetical protein